MDVVPDGSASATDFDSMVASWIYDGKTVPGDAVLKILKQETRSVKVPATKIFAATTKTIELPQSYKFTALSDDNAKKKKVFQF